MILSFIFFLSLFAGIGLASARKSRKSKADYYLADQSVAPWLVGLSAVATNNSGYMFIGVIGYTYTAGLEAIWLMVGWITGDFLASLFVHKKLRSASNQSDAVTFPALVSSWGGGELKVLRKLLGLAALVFLLSYAAAQLLAGSKALSTLLEWPAWAGALLGGVLILAYCLAGGIRASIWTDAAQSVVMIIAMTILLVVGLDSVGGFASAFAQMSEIEGYTNLIPDSLAFPGILGLLAFLIGWGVAGFSVIGQPHIMVRFMTLNNTDNMVKAKSWYYSWFIAFYCAASAVGLLSRILLPDTQNFDAELALPTIAMELMHPVMVGLVLSAIFAATMSTADSLVLSCSGALSHDLPNKPAISQLKIKLITAAVIVSALILALTVKEGVFQLVIFSWSGLGSVFAPLMIARTLQWQVQENYAIAAVIAGLSACIAWRLAGLHGMVFEGLVGVALGLIILRVGHTTKRSSALPST